MLLWFLYNINKILFKTGHCFGKKPYRILLLRQYARLFSQNTKNAGLLQKEHKIQ